MNLFHGLGGPFVFCALRASHPVQQGTLRLFRACQIFHSFIQLFFNQNRIVAKPSVCIDDIHMIVFHSREATMLDSEAKRFAGCFSRGKRLSPMMTSHFKWNSVELADYGTSGTSSNDSVTAMLPFTDCTIGQFLLAASTAFCTFSSFKFSPVMMK